MARQQQPSRVNPGFQGSETSDVEVQIYSQKGDPILFVPAGTTTEFQRYRPGPRSNPDTVSPSLIAVSTSKAIGPASGNFSLTAKAPSQTARDVELFDRIVDDDWVDITFKRHGRRWHTMRGLVDDVRKDETVAGNGATSVVYNIIGRDFGKIWEQTSVWFSVQAKENVHGHVAARVFTIPDSADSQVSQDTLILKSPAAAVRGYLFGFLEELQGFGRANWDLPRTLPNAVNEKFLDSLYFHTARFSNLPRRQALDPSFIMAGGTLWDLAKEWSDPLFTELFVDITPDQDPALEGYSQGVELPIEDSRMTVIFRDKPFPIVADGWTGDKGKDSQWFKLPEFIIPKETIVQSSVGRTGMERFNAFFVTSPLYQELLGGNAIDIVAPLWDKQDISVHGLRRFDVQSKYGIARNLPPTDPHKKSLLNLLEEQREIIRDWYAINPYLRNGTLSLGVGMPDIRVGSRARIPGQKAEEQDESYYIESVSHNWSFGSGTKTSLGVTRGWRGTDRQLLATLQRLKSRYIVEPTATPEETSL